MCSTTINLAIIIIVAACVGAGIGSVVGYILNAIRRQLTGKSLDV